MKSLLRDKTTSVCLICGHKGHHDIIVTNISTYLNSSGTSLANFLFKVVGEEPCYSLSQVVCKQCFLLLDRLDTYQSRSAEIIEYITSRYQDTKFEFLGSRQKISELIVSSLSNLKNFKNGTTLNVCDELSVTLFQENFSKAPLTPSNDAPIKKEQNITDDTTTKKRNLLGKNIGLKRRKRSPYNKNSNKNKNNNNNIDNGKNPDLTTDLHDLSPKSLSQLEICFSNVESLKIESEFSDSEKSSNGDITINSSKKRDPCKNAVDSSLNINDNDDDDTNTSNPTSNDSCSDSGGERHQKSNEEELENIEVKQHSAHNLVEETQDLEPNLTEALLVQNSLASNILQSFISTSLWMNSPETSNQAGFSSLTKQQQQRHILALQKQNGECDEDLTVESLGNAVGSINDKKRRLELKNTGQSYINTKGKLIEAKKVWPQDCSRCHLKCNGRLNEEMRSLVFAEYWGLGDYDRQREYLATHMEREERVGPSGHSRTVILYYLTLKNKKYQVCRQFFLKTLDVSEKASRIVLEKKLKGEFGVETSQQCL
ncbi:hypothetical protein Anas_05826 [Armadillidium nasatum]|uniref:ZAD domain-containing protein n=1 Tax=Armadillidium nasatum TaxID=96803 RepID=A0A5N5TME3_9CRUS|nr:hypothetical protein Anas_05826 [Armadillidium nasatum]